MKQYHPSKSEVKMLIIGVMLGSLFATWFESWVVVAMLAPLIILIELISYFYAKNKESYKQDLKKATNVEELTKN